MDLPRIYAPIQDDLDRLGALLERELIAPDPFIGELVRHVLATPGKMIRPALVCLSAQAGGGAGESRLWIAAAVELIHIASLIHDDIIDDADTRRNAPTVNVRWGNQIAVLLGDYLFARAFDLLSRVRDTGVAEVMARASVEMSQAEILQIKYGGEPHDDEAVYFRIIGGKTAHLFAAACRAGALAAGNARAAQALGVFGLEWGMAFQITDDALDLTSQAESLGKPIHSDIRGGKVTLPLIHTLRAAAPADRARLIELLADTSGDGRLAEVEVLLARYRGVEYALRTAAEYSRRAAAALAELPPTPARESLRALTEFVVVRAR
ncbi:MAG TPA: polyprenyl synthetase family protein [bacterium]|nr:polyprenyl synthetase family protein [bacterium]